MKTAGKIRVCFVCSSRASLYGRVRSENVAKSKERDRIDGQFTTIPTDRSISISSMVQPSRWKAEAWPPITGPPPSDPLGTPGAATACVIPFTLATGRWSLAGWTAVAASICGL